ncbi:nuclease-related domain-containing protein [Siminovitchia sediminis]|uniref:Nuclease-related domain-containing protein n=1 Tax=Siminovitchia sediminis TaxID=1274353 RepID=A0ABW4KG16_9BACI
MIVKTRDPDEKVLKLEALIRRLPRHHLKLADLKSELANRRSGIRGEKSIDYHLTFLPDKEYYILHDLRLQNGLGYYFQMDTLILSPYFMTLLEINNYSGHIVLDHTFEQLIQFTNHGDKRVLPNPIPQLNRQEAQLKSWLASRKFNLPPIEPLAVMSNPSAFIESRNNTPFSQQIIHSYSIDSKIKEFQNKYHKEIFSKNTIYALTKLFMNKHTPGSYHPLREFQISVREILKGVHCPKCSFLPMNRTHGTWTCPSCKGVSKNAHIAALADYILLIGDTITNPQMQEFLQLPNRHVVHRLLSELKLKHEGGTRYRKYLLPYSLIPLQNK